MTVAKAVTAGTWSAIDIVTRQVISFIIAIVLARLLSPSDFGAIALLAFFSGLSIVFIQGGLSTALVQRQQSTYAEENAVFWANLTVGIFFALAIIAASPTIARFYELPVLEPLMFVAAAQVVLSALGAVHNALLNRDLRFAALTKVGLISSICSGAAALASALAGWGVWTLAVQLLVSAATTTLACWWISDWRPTWKVRFQPLKPLVDFGAYLSLSSVLEVIYAQGFALVVGKLHGFYDLGLFTRATTTQALPGSVLSAIISRVALPLFASRANDVDALRRGLQMSLALAMLLSLPIVVGLALLSDLVMLCLFGEKWVPAAKILTILALAGALLPFHVLNLQMLLALGKTKSFFAIEIKKKVIGIAAVILGSLFGIEGLAYALVFGSVASLVLNIGPVSKLIGYGLVQQLWNVRDIVFSAVVMSIAILLLRMQLSLEPWPQVLVLSAAGAFCYFACGILLRLPSFTSALAMIRTLVPLNRRAGLPSA